MTLHRFALESILTDCHESSVSSPDDVFGRHKHLMDQYRLTYRAHEFGDIARRPALSEYVEARECAVQLGLGLADLHRQYSCMFRR